jgi:hypothetical protein
VRAGDERGALGSSEEEDRMKGNRELIGALNEILTGELTAIN